MPCAGAFRRSPAAAIRSTTESTSDSWRPAPIPGARNSVLFVGRLCPEKGVHVLMEALRRLPARHFPPELHLVGPLDVAPKEFVDPFSRDPLFKGLEMFYSRPTAYQEHLRKQAEQLGERRLCTAACSTRTSAHTTPKPAFSCFRLCGTSRSAFR